MPGREEEILLYAALDGSLSPRAWNSFVELCDDAPDLAHIQLHQYDLRGLNFDHCTLDGGDLSSVRADGVSFKGASLSGVDFARASLQKACFRSSTGRAVNFSYADLHRADLSWASFRYCSFMGVQLASVALWKTDLRDSRLPEFRPSTFQDFVATDQDPNSQSLESFVARVSRVTGKTYAIGGSIAAARVEVPTQFSDDPIGSLIEVVRRNKLTIKKRVSRSGDIIYDIINLSSRL